MFDRLGLIIKSSRYFRTTCLFFFTLILSQEICAHSTQWAYCITPEGRIRLFAEHWHGNLSPAQTANAVVTFSVQNTATGVTNTFSALPAGVVWDTPIGSLSGCKSGINIISACDGRANVYNDWAFWDFTPPDCFVNLRITLVSVTGSQAYIFDRACTTLFPFTFEDTFVDCAPPTITCPANITYEATGGEPCGRQVNGLAPQILFDDCTPTSDIVLEYDITGALTVTDGMGNVSEFFPKGMSTVVYSATDNNNTTSTCSFVVTVEDSNGPTTSCPSNITLECGDPNNSSIINEWLDSFTATDVCGVQSLDNNFDPNGFVFIDTENQLDYFDLSRNPRISTGHLSHSLLSSGQLLSEMTKCQYSKKITLYNKQSDNLFDYQIQLNLMYQEGMAPDFSDLLFLDAGGRVLPYWIEGYNDKHAAIWLKVAELPALKNSEISLQYGGCVETKFTPEEVFTSVARNGELYIPDAERGYRVISKIKNSSSKNHLIIEGEESNYKVTVGYTESGNVNSQIIRLVEGGKPFPLYLEGNQTYGESVILDFERNQKTNTTTHIIRNESGRRIIEDKFVDDGFLISDRVKFVDDSNVEFIAVVPSKSGSPEIISEVSKSTQDVAVRTMEMFDDNPKAEDKYVFQQKMMDCNCTVTQGSQTFSINTLQNAQDDVAFYAYGTPNGASANTGLELAEEVVLFLYENTLTGEISLFIILDDARDPTGGRGTIDFFCLPTTSTLDFSDDPGEITGIFPTVTANWGWAPCCTDGALIGNVGCNTTFDFYANFSSGINGISWVSGSLAAPVYNSFGSITEPVRISCGNAQPTCCRNTNSVTITHASCPSSTDGMIDVTVDANGAPYTYLWSTGATSQDLSGLGVGMYTVTITDKDNCEQIIDNEIESDETPMLNCPTNATVSMDGTMASIELSDLPYTVTYPCPDSYTETCMGCGTFDCSDANMVRTVTVIVEDVLGNTDMCTINVLIENMPPDINCPDDLNLECDDSFNSAAINDWLSSVTATDNEGDVISIEDNFDPNGYSFTSDGSSSGIEKMKSSGKQSVQGPKDFYYILDIVNKSETRPAMLMMGGKGSQVVTFTATDECGNTSTCTATITIDDTTPPVITCPNDITVECGDPNNNAIITNWLDNATAIDACTDHTVTNNFSTLNPNECGGVRTITFTAEDECDNRSTCTSRITHLDTTPPEFMMKPQDAEFECVNANGATAAINAWLAANGNGMATDDCDATVTWSSALTSTTELCGYTYERLYTFTIRDDCGNTSTATATATVVDNTPPVLNLRADITLNCATTNDANLASYLTNYGSVSDLCTVAADIDVEYRLYNSISGCGETYTEVYEFTATDECGNTTIDYFSFTEQDIVAPTWVGLPGHLDVECGDPDNNTQIQEWLDAIEDAITDACGGTTYVTNDWDGSLLETCNASNWIAITVEDECGNSRSFNRRLRLLDRINPVFLNCPSDMTVNVDVDNCDANVVFSTPVAYDQCSPGIVPVQTLGPASGSTFPLGTTLIRFDVRDNCNRLGRCDFNITVVDSDTPEISCPSNVEVCTGDGICTWRSDNSVLPMGMDNCPNVVTQVEITGATTLTRRTGTAANRTFNLGTSQVCYYMTDAAGNTSSCCFDVIVSDCEDPVISCPANVTNAVCGSSAPASFNATATDNCDTNIDIQKILFNTISNCGSTNTQVYQFIATDNFGNDSQCFANYTSIDNTPPAITTAASDGDSNCAEANADLLDWLNNNGGAVATDNCGAVTWTNDFNGAAMTGCSGVTSLSVTFTATDECGNTSTTSADFMVDDTENPMITCPTDITLECDDVLNDAVIELWLQSAVATDNCTDPVITNNYPGRFTADCGTTGNNLVTFTATDDCDNFVRCNARITIEDSLPPEFLMKPQDLIVECGDADADPSAWIKNNGGAMASDQCDDNLTWNVTEGDAEEGCGDSESIIYTFTVTDDCGNSTSATALYVFEDTTVPQVIPPTDITVECADAAATSLSDWQDGASATDNCGTDGFTFEAILFNTISGCGDTNTEVYQFTATDACGNQASALASYTIVDSTDPSITCPSTLNLFCGVDDNPLFIAEWLTSATGMDDCGEVTFTNNFDGVLPANCGGVKVVTFTATDDCGNTETCNSRITLDDNSSPDFVNCPEDMTINVDVDLCGSNPIFSDPIPMDNCDVTAIQTGGPTSGSTFPVGTSTITYTATDDCGNTQTCQFDITVIDSDDPIILCPSSDIIACTDSGVCTWESADIGPSLGVENCPGFTINYAITGQTSGTGTNDASGTTFNLGVSTVCYTISDASGNTSSCCFNVIVNDCESPQVTCPADMTVECDGSGNTTQLNSWLGTSSSSDNCDNTLMTSQDLDNTISMCGGGETFVYQFIAEDDAGNSDYCRASFTIEDTTNPVVTPASNMVSNCEDAPEDYINWLNNNGGATATDVCSGTSWTHNVVSETPNCSGFPTFIVDFIVTDECGNSSSSRAQFSAPDNTNPIISCPADITLECGNDTNDAVITNWLETASATDACSELTIANTYPNTFAATCGDAGVYTITFTTVDDCRNLARCSSTISILDRTIPVFEVDPQDITIECASDDASSMINNWIKNNGGGVASDNCGDVTWSVTSGEPIAGCGDTGTVIYTWTITDECGNTNTATSSVITEDTTVPEIDVPNDLTVECDGAGNLTQLSDWLESVSGSDDCGDVTLDSELYNTISGCGGSDTEVHLFTATDECGNVTTGLASFTIEDSVDPVITCPEALELICGDESNDLMILNWLQTGTSTDVCSDVIITNNIPSELPDLSCGTTMTTSVTFTATDDCGNTSSCASTITMIDEDAPRFENCPTDITVNVDVDLCESNVVYSTPLAFDNCDEDVDVVMTSGIASGDIFDLGTTTILFTATDDCGNTATCQFDITVLDSDIPSISCPSVDVEKCVDPGTCGWRASDSVSPVFSENCPDEGFDLSYTITGATNVSSPLVGYHDVDADDIIFAIGRSRVCYTITDEAGNSSSCCFDVIITDCEAPNLSCSADLIVECAATNAIQLNTWLNSAVATDNCDALVDMTFDVWNTISGCGNTSTVEYLFTATDDAGNTTTCIRSFEVQDNTAPVITTVAPDVTVECDGVGNQDQLLAWLGSNGNIPDSDVDEFCNGFTWDNNFEDTQFVTIDPCDDDLGYYQVLFWVTDDCGNRSNRIAKRFIIEDTTAPELTCPANITLECSDPLNEEIIGSWLLTASASDGCSTVSLVNDYDDEFEAACGLSGEYTVAFTATDACDNVTECERTITIEDTTDPTIELVAADLILECSDANNAALIADWIESNGGAVASDACSTELEWSYEALPVLSGCGDTESTTYIFTVTDQCDNESTTTAQVITEDTTPPNLDEPASLTEECGDIETTVQQWIDSATGDDTCGEVTVSAVLWNTISDCGGTNTETYLFTATDACGNETTAFSDYILEDTSDPTVVCPSDIALICGDENNDQLILNWLNSATATDAFGCSEVEISNNYPNGLPSLACNGGAGLLITFTATDACDNTHTCQSRITMDDSADPYFSNCPQDMTVNVDVDLCETNVVYSTPIALDNCDEDVAVVMTSGIASGQPFPIGTTTILFTATDDCGNTTTCEFDITVEDSDIPTIECPSNDVVVCTDTGTCVWESDDRVSSIYNENCPDEGYTVTYAVTGATVATSAATGQNDIADDGVVFNLGESRVCYTIEDDAGNSSQCCFDVIVEDCENPVVTCPEGEVVECDGMANNDDLSDWLAEVTATDNCDTDISITSELNNTISGCGNTYTLLYSFTAEDNFGNTHRCLSSFRIIDTTDPVIDTEASDETIECSGGSNGTDALLVWLENNGGASASDICNEVEWSNDFAGFSDGCGETGEIEVIFTATDDCGNTSTTSAVFTIEDTTAPELTCPADITLECADELNEVIIENWLDFAMASDGCSTVSLVNDYDDEFEAACGLSGEYTVTFTATDACDNVTECERTITIEDTTDPTIELAAADLILECSDANNAALISDWLESNGGAVASDACSTELEWSYEALPVLSGCGDTESTTYIFTVTDQCDNESTTTAQVITEDTTPPNLDEPASLTEECGDIETTVQQWIDSATGDDTCGEVTVSAVLWNTISDCGGTNTETYLFTATDACGNETTAFSDYILEDTSDPTVVCPADIALVCGDENNDQLILNWLNSATATDAFGCSDVEITNNYPNGLPSLACNGGAGLLITFTATDACENTHTCQSRITMDDSADPYFSNCPQDMTVNVDVDLCETNVVYSTPIALDNCDEDVTVVMTSGIASGQPFPIGTTTILFTATDDCGNTTTCEFDITVEDSDIPTIECPSNDVVVCTDTGTCVWESDDRVSSIYNENCPDEGYTVTYTVTGATVATSAATGQNDIADDGVVFNLGESRVCYTIEDDAGNSSQCCFDVIVEDCENPVVTCPEGEVVECDGMANNDELSDWLAEVTATDNCDTDISITSELNNTISGCGNTYTLIYSFTAEDNFGNTHRCLSSFRIIDTTVPVIDTEASDETIECSGGSNGTDALLVWLENNGGASASDICNEVEWSNDFAGFSDGCGETGEVEVTFTATDDCGNTSTTSAVFTIEDTTAPELTCPADITLECADELNEVIIENWLDFAMASDGCSTVTLVNDYDDEFEAACGLSGEYTVTFTASDACDNVTECERKITIEDTTDPTIELAAADLILECSDANNAALISDWIESNGGAVASDACSTELEWSFEALPVLSGCGDTESTTYIFTVTDQCDNESTTTAQVITEDTTPPNLDEPASLTEECGDIETTVQQWIDSATGDDTCGEVTVSAVLWNTISDCGGTNTETYLFTATDACGNETTAFSDYILEDTSDPTVVCPSDIALICGDENNDQLILNWLNSATATDAFGCSDVEITNNYPNGLPSLACNGGAGLLITFTATDACDNTHTCQSRITMDDSADPYFSNCPQDMTVNVDVDLCETNVVYSTPIALDNCDEDVTVVMTSGIASGQPFPIGTTTILFTATDDCGNTTTCEFDITVEDSDIPTIECPSNDVVVCTDTGTCVWESDDRVSSIYNENCPDEGYTVTYTVTGATVATSAATGQNDIADDGVVFNLGESRVCYTIEDDAGNSSQCCFEVIVEDCENPTITCSDQLDVACGSEDVAGWFDAIAATAQDNCAGPVTVDTLLITDFSSCGNTFERVYLFTVTDNAGNQSTCTATYETDDNAVPTITDASDLILECSQANQSTALQAWLNNNGGATATDACSLPIVWTNNYLGDLSDECASTGEVEVTFTATDDCGNSSSTTAIFRIIDTTAPVLVVPDDITLECADSINDAVIQNWLVSATSEDICSGTLEVTHDYDDDFEERCGLTGMYTVTFTTEDDCGNETVLQSTITIEDTTNPTIDVQAADIILECGDPNNEASIAIWLMDNGGARASDACSDEDLVWSYEEGMSLESCGISGTQYYIFTVTDNCGNTSTTKAAVIIEDTTAPTFDVLPADQMLECFPTGNDLALISWLNNQGGAEVSDVCSDSFTWEYDLVDVRYDCDDNGTRTYRFTVFDECGNSSFAEADFIIFDSTPPTITNEAQPFTAECNGSSNSAEILNWLNNNGFATAEDICGTVTWTNNYGSVQADCGATGAVTVTFTATDECGNSSSTSSTFTINDNTSPVWEIEPQDMEIECDGSNDPMGQIEAWLNTVGGGEAKDECSLISYSNDFEMVDLECNMQGGVVVTFTATDACGNFSDIQAMLVITDDVPPTITSPAKDQNVECNGTGNTDELQQWLDNNGGATAEDLCSPEITWAYTLMSTRKICRRTEVHTYMFTATDACDNTSVNTIADFIISDTTVPVFDMTPQNMTVECDGEGNDAELETWLSNDGGGIASDICSDTIYWDWNLVTEEDSCGVTGIQVYRFTITDECGNQSTHDATFIIEDTTVPDVVAGEDMLMEECDASTIGNYDEFDFWLSDNAGATATDMCGNISWSNNYHPDNWETICGNTQQVDVIFTATDDCGNQTSTTHRFGIGDVTPPEFTNCPKPPIVVDAPDSWCSAFVNFEIPEATDNCGEVTITKTDDTNLDTGDLFPVGTTILTYIAEDECGNTSYCELKISVNDFHTPPTITCPESVTVNSDGKMCGAVVNGLAPTDWEDNCPDNATIMYEVADVDGNTLHCGFEDVSGYKFPVGISTVNYTIVDQPLILITEVIQDGTTTGVEISNFGPAAVDVSCLNIVREGATPETHNIPNGTIIPVGGVYTQDFSTIGAGVSAGYYIEFIGRILDGVSINGHITSTYNFDGLISGTNIHRQWSCDHDDADDFLSASSCFMGSYGSFNPLLTHMTPNGTSVGLQEGVASQASCNFTVEVIDDEAPFCAEYDTTAYCIDTPMQILPQQCTNVTFDVPVGTLVHDIDIRDMVISIADASDLSFSLTSPEGQTIYLFSQLCNGTADINISLDDHVDTALSGITCTPLGGGNTYQPIGDFFDFYNQDAGGTWTLSIENSGDDTGTIQSVCLDILELLPYSQMDVVINNDPGQCGAEFTWMHPISSDNCGLASMTISYETNDDIALPPVGDIRQGVIVTEYFEVGTTTVIYTMTDAYGNKSQCSFDVTINDGELPLIDPDDCIDQVIQLGPHDCEVSPEAVLLPTVQDNCGTENISNNLDLEGLVEGLHEISYFYADEFGNIVECQFEITVLPFVPDSDQLACVGQVNLSLGPDCMETVTADMMLVPGGEYGCTDDFCVTIMDEDGNEIGNSNDGTNVVDQTHIGQLLTVRVCFDCNGGNCCWGNLLVENKLIPDVVCPRDTVVMCNQIFIPEVTGTPAIESCEQEVYFSYQDDLHTFDMCQDTTALITRVWYVTDESNNVIECNQQIAVTGFDIKTVVIPNDTIITNTVSCEEVALDPSLTHPDSTGWASFGNVPIYETGDGLCSHFWNYEDQILRNCEGSYEIIRKWIIRDMCDDIDSKVNPLLEKYQSIKVIDDMPPVFEDCPTDVTVSSYAYDCTADILLNDYMPTIREMCGSIKDTLITVTPGTVRERPGGQYYLTNLSAGTHTVRITVRDQCSNYSRCTFTITVVDDHGPNVVCDQDLHISLSNTGVAELQAEIFDDGSFDNCTALGYEVFRMNNNCGVNTDTIPGESITVCCADVGEDVMVMLRVWDDADGNYIWGSEGDHYAECMVRVHVSDFPIPQLTCPDDVTIACGEDYSNINLTGAPAATSICNYAEATFSDDVVELTECNSGTVTRTWTITESGQTCKQVITLQAAEPFTEDNIIWPYDYEGGCENGVPYIEPTIDRLGCSIVGVNAVSDTFYFSQDACFKIIHEWTVIDWCQRSATSDDDDDTGRWSHTQVIKITESESPSVISCDPIVVDITTDDCTIPELILTNTAIDNSCGMRQDIDWTYQLDADGDGQFEIEGSEQSDDLRVVLNDVQGGNLTVLWTAIDGCGNQSSCTQDVIIQDRKAPNAYCLDLAAAVMPSNGEVTLWITDFDAGSTDNCTPEDDLLLSFFGDVVATNMTYTCDDIPNGVSQVVDVELWVTDGAGNQAHCTTSIELQDNSDACPDNTNMMATIGGHIYTEEVQPIQEVEAYITDQEVIDEMYMTETDGVYAFDNLLMTNAYQIKPRKDKGWLNGVTTLDLILIQNHIIGKEMLPSPYKIIAGDINNDSSLTATDLIQLRQLILGVTDHIETNESWRFVEESFQFIDPLYPFPFSERIIAKNENMNSMDNDFVGVKIGDVNNSAELNMTDVALEQRDVYDLHYRLDIESKERKTLIPVFTNEEGIIYGFQMTIDVEGAIIHDIISGSAEITKDNFKISNQGLKMSWNSPEGTVAGLSTPIFFIDVTLVNNNPKLSIVSDDVKSEIYVDESLITKIPILSLRSDKDFDKAILYQNEPNPFIDKTTIKFYIPKSQEVKLEFYEASGKVLYSIIKQLEQGEHQIDVDAEEVGVNGLIYYRLISDQYSESKKMMIIK